MLVLFWTALIGECIGYVIRIVAMQHPSTGIYILTTLLILLSPCAMALVSSGVRAAGKKLPPSSGLLPSDADKPEGDLS